MTIHAYRYRLPLKRPLPLGDTSYDYREGILLEQDGEWADASPLPYFSAETIEDVIGALRDEQAAPPSLAFAIDSLSTPMEACCVPMNVLLQGTHNQILEVAGVVGASDCSTLKLKVGRSDVASDIELVRQVQDRLRDEQRLRLDANRAWTFAEAIELLNGIESDSIEYIEEPLQDFAACEQLFEQTGVSYALDETLATEPLNRRLIDRFPNVKAFVCKPTIVGGRDRIEWLAQTGKPIVFSAAFESGVGVGRIAQLAQEFSPDIPAGLDTYSWLESDVLETCPSIRDGYVYFRSNFDVKRGGLRKVDL